MFDELRQLIDHLDGEAGYATRGDVDALVFSGLDVHNMLGEIGQEIDKIEDGMNARKVKVEE